MRKAQQKILPDGGRPVIMPREVHCRDITKGPYVPNEVTTLLRHAVGGND